MKADRDWMINAACREHPPDDMFPAAKDKPGQRWARQICRNCPVQLECANYATETGATHGIWAGEYRNTRTYQTAANRPRTAQKAAHEPTTAKAKNPATPAQPPNGKPRNDD